MISRRHGHSLMIQSILYLKQTITHLDFVIDNPIITDPEEIAITVNAYFLNIGQSLSDQIDYAYTYDQYLTKPTHSRITFDHGSEKLLFIS